MGSGGCHLRTDDIFSGISYIAHYTCTGALRPYPQVEVKRTPLCRNVGCHCILGVSTFRGVTYCVGRTSAEILHRYIDAVNSLRPVGPSEINTFGGTLPVAPEYAV